MRDLIHIARDIPRAERDEFTVRRPAMAADAARAPFPIDGHGRGREEIARAEHLDRALIANGEAAEHAGSIRSRRDRPIDDMPRGFDGRDRKAHARGLAHRDDLAVFIARAPKLNRHGLVDYAYAERIPDGLRELERGLFGIDAKLILEAVRAEDDAVKIVPARAELDIRT